MGDNDVELRFENMSVGATYSVYFSYSGNGFDSHSDYHYFTYDGTPMELVLPVTAWACSISYSWNVYLYDFRYQLGHTYGNWHLGSDSGSMDGPCETMSYDSSVNEGFDVSYDEDTEFVETNNTIILEATNLQTDLPYYMESKVYFDG